MTARGTRLLVARVIWASVAILILLPPSADADSTDVAPHCVDCLADRLTSGLFAPAVGLDRRRFGTIASPVFTTANFNTGVDIQLGQGFGSINQDLKFALAKLSDGNQAAHFTAHVFWTVVSYGSGGRVQRTGGDWIISQANAGSWAEDKVGKAGENLTIWRFCCSSWVLRLTVGSTILYNNLVEVLFALTY